MDRLIQEKTPPVEDAALQRRINELGQRLVAVNDRKEVMFHFLVLESADLNAFALPGGYTYVYRGLIEKMKEDEVAAVLAHEIAHTSAKHAVKHLQAALGYNVLIAAALVGLGARDSALAQDIGQLSGALFDLLSKGYSREDELQADRLSVRDLKRAGIDPYAMVRALDVLTKESGPSGRVFEVLSTHPRMEERIRKVKEEIEKPSVSFTTAVSATVPEKRS
jgi:predicted Zn-dependent protease